MYNQFSSSIFMLGQINLINLKYKMLNYLFHSLFFIQQQLYALLKQITTNKLQQTNKQQIQSMKESKSKPDIEAMKDYNTKRILNSDFPIIPLNVKLTSNPFLKDQEKFHFLVYKLTDYNKRIAKELVSDQYEVMVYERLHSILCDLPYIFTKDDQIKTLEEAIVWFKEQQKLVQQRRNQGEVRYQMTKQVRYGVEPEKKDAHVSQKTEVEEIPSKAIAREMMPFRRGWRTTHKELDIPARRLNQYKRKILNIAPFIEPKEDKKMPRVLYPKIPPFQPKFDEPEQAEHPVDRQPAEGQPPAENPPELGPDGQPIQPPKQQQNAADQQQDLGGFGQQPGEPEQDDQPPQQGGDKLRPKLKSFVLEYRDINRKQFKGQYSFYRGEEEQPERRMEERYLKMYQTHLQKQKQDEQSLLYLEEWGRIKGKNEKQWQKRLENGMLRNKYSFSIEQPPKQEMLSKEDQLKYGFTENLRTKPKYTQYNMNMSMTDGKLPKITNQENSIYQKSIRNDRLKSLKNKFSKLLNLKDDDEKETRPSICQFTSRKRGLSEIIRNHSMSKQRLNQIDEVTRIKEKLARNKCGVDVRALSMGLCAPEEEQKMEQFTVPGKDLPSNPFMVQTKKKKKKKK